MTLSITVATPKYICQASDRRLVRWHSNGGFETYTDQANKELYLRLKDIWVLVSYQGIGEDFTGNRTQTWLIDELKHNHPHENSAEKVFTKLAEQATLWVQDMYRRCSRTQRKFLCHTFHAVGWHHCGRPAFYQISNFEHLDTGEESSEPWPEFQFEHSILQPNSSRIVISGVHQAVKKKDKELLVKVVKSLGAKPKDVANIIVKAMRGAASSSKLISQNCVSCIMLPGMDIQCRYHSAVGGGIVYAPDYFNQMIIGGFEFSFGNEPLPYVIKQVADKHGLVAEQVCRGMRKLPAKYKTGDPLPPEITPKMKKFLDDLPLGITENRIKESI